MFFNNDLTLWENLYRSIKYTYILCIILLIVLLIGRLTAKTEEKKIMIGNLTFVSIIIAMLVILSSSLMLPIVRANMDKDTNEKKEINVHSRYESPTSKTDCFLCGTHQNDPISFYLGENNIAVLDLNTFDILRLEINRYDDNKNLVEKYAGYMQTSGTSFQDGTNMTFYVETDRGCAEGTISLNESILLSFDSVSTFLSENLPSQIYFGTNRAASLLVKQCEVELL